MAFRKLRQRFKNWRQKRRSGYWNTKSGKRMNQNLVRRFGSSYQDNPQAAKYYKRRRRIKRGFKIFGLGIVPLLILGVVIGYFVSPGLKAKINEILKIN